VHVLGTVASKVPEFDRELATFYVDGSGNLHRSDPDQQRFSGLSPVRGAEEA